MLKDRTTFIQKVILSKELKINGHQVKEHLLSKDLIILSQKETLIREPLKNGHQVKELLL